MLVEYVRAGYYNEGMVVFAKEYRAGGLCGQRRAYKRAVLLRRLDGREPTCHWCSTPLIKGENMTLDHVRDRARGGSNDTSNLVLACEDCNQMRAWDAVPASHLAMFA